MLDGMINFFHLLATTMLIGGMIYIRYILLPSLSQFDSGRDD